MRRVLLFLLIFWVAACEEDQLGVENDDAGVITSEPDATVKVDAEAGAPPPIDSGVDAAEPEPDGGDASVPDAVVVTSTCGVFNEQLDAPYAPSTAIERISVSTDGQIGNRWSSAPVLSYSGRWISFVSDADNLVANDTNLTNDIFVRDRLTGITQRVSVNNDCQGGNGASWSARISADGTVAAFSSEASNLVPQDTNGFRDVFVRNLRTGETKRVSVASDGTEANGESDYPELSEDGRYIAFSSTATNLVPGDTTGYPYRDIFRHDLLTGETIRLSVTTAGDEVEGIAGGLSMSSDGNSIAFTFFEPLASGDTNDFNDVYVRDVLAGTTSQVSAGGNDSSFIYRNCISADGRFVAFRSHATNFDGRTSGHENVFVRDRMLGTTTLWSHSADGVASNGATNGPTAISADGRYLAFSSHATNLIPGFYVEDQMYGFIRDLSTGTLVRLIPPDGPQPDGAVHDLALSGDGRSVGVDSNATTLVSGDTNGTWDVYVFPNPL